MIQLKMWQMEIQLNIELKNKLDRQLIVRNLNVKKMLWRKNRDIDVNGLVYKAALWTG